METFVNLALLAALYFAPTIAARTGRRGSVFVVNLFLGWTFIGWVVALVMAVRSREAAPKQPPVTDAQRAFDSSWNSLWSNRD